MTFQKNIPHGDLSGYEKAWLVVDYQNQRCFIAGQRVGVDPPFVDGQYPLWDTFEIQPDATRADIEAVIAAVVSKVDAIGLTYDRFSNQDPWVPSVPESARTDLKVELDNDISKSKIKKPPGR